MNTEKSENNPNGSNLGSSHCSDFLSRLLKIVNEGIDLYRDIQDSGESPEYLFELREGIYHILENIPKNLHPPEESLPLVFWNGGLDMDSNGSRVA